MAPPRASPKKPPPKFIPYHLSRTSITLADGRREPPPSNAEVVNAAYQLWQNCISADSNGENRVYYGGPVYLPESNVPREQTRSPWRPNFLHPRPKSAKTQHAVIHVPRKPEGGFFYNPEKYPPPVDEPLCHIPKLLIPGEPKIVPFSRLMFWGQCEFW